MTTSLRQRLLQVLVDSKLLTRPQLDQALAAQAKTGQHLGQILVSTGWITQRDLMVVLSRGLNIPAIDLAKYRIDPDVARLIPERLARQYHAIPIAWMGKRLTVAMADPMNIFAVDDMALLTQYEIVPVVAGAAEIMAAIETLYGAGDRGPGPAAPAEPAGAAEAPTAEEVVNLSSPEAASTAPPIVKMVNAAIAEALTRRASDLHLEPGERDVRVRYRVDGDLQEAFRVPKRYQNALLARIKILARMDISDWRLPQDGRFRVRFQGREVDFRVSALPMTHGTKLVLRILDRRTLSVGLDALGFLPTSLQAVTAAAARPHGMILVTGPTGSGKSTTLYAVLSQLNTPERNVVTIEDPVEYQVDGITQIQVHPEIQLTFSAGLRALLRQNPDVMMIGEIRDGETADIAIKSSLTGHLVLSTLHTNDAPSAVTRLVDLGVEPFLIASSLALVAAQRLCRELCPHCRVPLAASEMGVSEAAVGEVLARVGAEPARGEAPARPSGQPARQAAWHGPKGCPRCLGSGYLGRFGILETMTVDDGLRDLIVARAPADQLKAYAQAHGMRTLRQEGLVHAAAGRTSLAEVLRVTAEE